MKRMLLLGAGASAGGVAIAILGERAGCAAGAHFRRYSRRRRPIPTGDDSADEHDRGQLDCCLRHGIGRQQSCAYRLRGEYLAPSRHAERGRRFAGESVVCIGTGYERHAYIYLQGPGSGGGGDGVLERGQRPGQTKPVNERMGAPLTSGAVTPANADELVVSCLGFFTASESTTVSPLTLVDVLPYKGGYSGSQGTASAYMVENAASEVNPTWAYAASARPQR